LGTLAVRIRQLALGATSAKVLGWRKIA